MIKNKVMFLIVAYVSINAAIVSGAEKERIICKKIMNMYAYSKGTLDQNDLALFIQSNEIASVTELIAVLERGKTLLNYDIVNMKTENKSASSYWATLVGAPFVSIIGACGYSNEDIKSWRAQNDLLAYEGYRRAAEWNSKPQYMDQGKFDIEKYDRLNPKPVEYVMQNLYIYKTLIAAGLIAIPVAIYKLYKHYTYACNKQKEIAKLDAIIEAIRGI